MGAVEGGRKPDALDCGAERKEGRELAREKRGERDEGSGRPGEREGTMH